jgi:hypothetical protein
MDCSSSRGRDLYAWDMADREGNKCITKKRRKSTPGASRRKVRRRQVPKERRTMYGGRSRKHGNEGGV